MAAFVWIFYGLSRPHSLVNKFGTYHRLAVHHFSLERLNEQRGEVKKQLIPYNTLSNQHVQNLFPQNSAELSFTIVSEFGAKNKLITTSTIVGHL